MTTSSFSPTTFDHQLASGDHLRLTWYGEQALRVQINPRGHRDSLVVTAQPEANFAWQTDPNGDIVSITSPQLHLSIHATGHIEFSQPNGKALFTSTDWSEPANTLPNAEDQKGAEQHFKLNDNDALYGLGQFQDGIMNRRGTTCTLIHGNVSVVVPFLASTGGWGLLWDNASHTEFSDDQDAGMRLWSEVADGIDYYVCLGNNAEAVIAGYRHLTGAAPLFPRGFYGFIQCKERYCTADELTSVVKEHRDRDIPLDVIVQDWRYWGDMPYWSSMVHDPEAYGDLPQAISDIHDMHCQVMISIWPVVGPKAALHKQLDEAGHLFPAIHWSTGNIYDAFSAEGRSIYWQAANDGLFKHDVDAWWMDGTEPEFADCHDQMAHKASLQAQRDTAAGSWARVLNAFSLVTTQGVYEGQRAASDDKRVFILTRSAFAGQQRYAAATWSGDISSNWHTFANQIPSGINFCAAGIPYWTTDNGAFFIKGRGGMFPDGVKDPAFREFFLRWTQYSAFCPLMRAHGTQTPRETWQFGEPGTVYYDGIKAMIDFRMRLMPYSYSLAYQAWANGGTPMQAIGMQFSHDSAAHDVGDQLCYGPALMACPVTEPMQHAPTETIDVLTTWLQSKVLDGAEAGEAGMRRRTWNGMTSTAPTADAIGQDTVVMQDFDYTWSGNLPEGVSDNTYSVEWTGALVAEKIKHQQMVIRVAGCIHVELAGHVVVDDWTDGPQRDITIDLPAAIDGAIPFRIVYGTDYSTGGDALLKIGWNLATDFEDLEHKPRQRQVYLPQLKSGQWYDLWSNEQIAGGQTITAAADLDTIPAYVPAGSILPLAEVKQWHDQTPDENLEIRIYPGADGTFTLYEDSGNGYAYEGGACCTIAITWDDRSNSVTIGEQVGAFDGMLTSRQFTVIRQDNGATKTIDYAGGAVTATITP